MVNFLCVSFRSNLGKNRQRGSGKLLGFGCFHTLQMRRAVWLKVIIAARDDTDTLLDTCECPDTLEYEPNNVQILLSMSLIMSRYSK